MNFFVQHQHQGYDPSSQSQETYNQSTNNYYSYSYSYPNPQFSGSINPYACQNPIVQPSHHEEQEPNPPGVTPTPPPLPELSQNSYFPYQAHVAAAGVPPVGTQPGAVVHQPSVQPLHGGVGNMGGIVPRGDVPGYPFPVSGLGRAHPLPMNAAIPFQDQTAIAHGGFHIQGQSFGGPRPKFSSGRSNRVRGHGRGRGRGRGRVHVDAPAQAKLGGPPQPVAESSCGQNLVPLQGPSVLPPPKAVSCEICKVECNTHEILQQHLNGKKHKKKLKVLEELQTINKRAVSGPTEQISTTELKTEQVQPQPSPVEILPNPEHCPSQPNPVETPSSQEINEECKVAGEKRKIEEVEEESAKKTRVGPIKRKLRGGKSNRKMNRSKSSVQPSKPKEAAPVPLICELCNVKCESVVVFQSHLAGKKHKSKAKQFLAQQAMQGVDQNNGDGSSLSMQIQA